jgi:putative transposase
MKTLEFKLSLTRLQQAQVDDGLAALKYVWNKGVELIKRFNDFNHYDKRFQASAPCAPIISYNHKWRATYPSCPIGWELADFELAKDFVNERSPCGIHQVRPAREGFLVNNLTFIGIQPVFTHMRNPDKPWLLKLSSKFIDGTVAELATAWIAFVKDGGKTRKPPKFKGKAQWIDTLINNNSKSIRIKRDRINIPRIGWVRAKGLSKRWPEGVPFCPMKICRKASGYYLQLTGALEAKPTKPPKVKAVGLDPGIAFVFSDDNGRQVKVPPYLERDLQKLKELQRKAQKQWDANHGLFYSQMSGWHPPMVDSEWQRKNWKRTQQKIAKIHEKIARRGRAFNHFESTKLVRQFDQIYLEDYRVSEIVGKVAPVDSGKMVVNTNDELTTIFDKNGRKLNRMTNRAALRNRVGQLWTMIETKGGKRVVRVERSGTSDECPKCGHVEEKLLKQRTHRCKECGYTAPRDVAAAQVIKKRGLARQDSCSEPKPEKKRGKRYPKKSVDDKAV